MPENQDRLFALLGELGVETRTVSHPPLFTVAQSRELRGQIAGAHTKNLFLKDKKGSYFLLTLEEEANVDLKTIHQRIGASGRVSFGKPDALMELLGVPPGAVTLFGLINDGAGKVRFFIDGTLLDQDSVNAHPLTNEATTAIAAADIERFVEATGHTMTILNLAA